MNRLACLALVGLLAVPAVRAAPAGAAASAPSGVSAAARDSALDWVSRCALYEVFVQDFSPAGNFRGVIRGLGRIQATGANVIWLMPIHPIGEKNRKGRLGSPYAAKDYRAINPAYGNEADLRSLVRAVHARGMKLILDWVPDHTSADHAWVKEHPDYYIRNEKGEPSVPREPNGKLTDWTDVLQLDYKNGELRREMIATMKYWLEQFDLDGFRVDVAGFIPYDFWREAIPALRAAVPRPILLLAEWDDLELHRIGFDLTYAWGSYDRLKEVWKGAPASSFVQGELSEMRAMPPGGMRMRFTTNHDKTAWDDPPVAIFGRGAGARAAFVAAALLPGRPLLYNGQEVESPQKLGLFEQEPVAWSRPSAARARTFYAAVMRLARTEPALIGRDLDVVETSAPDDVIAYRRGDVLVVVNARTKGVRAAVNGLDLAGARDLVSGARQKGDTITLPAYGAMVLKMRPQDWSNNAAEVFYQIFVRSFRDSNGDGIGDLGGIREKLGYLQDLGVTSLLLTPINPSPFYHNYFASSFEGVDSSFGGVGAYRELVKAIHARGMKLYLDQEIQYVAGDHPWWRESQRQPGSRYSRYLLYNDPGNTQPIWGASVPTYTGERVELAFVNLLDPKVKDYFQRLFVSLIDPNRDGRFDDGVDGFRIDHMMDDLDMKGRLTNLFADFWEPIFARTRATNPRIKIIAEQFDWGYGEDFLTRGGADMVFAFPLRNAMKSLNPRAIADTASEMQKRTPPGKGQLVFIENHDMNRFASEMNGDVRKEKIGAALNILFQGTPLIYYGQEIGMKGRQNKSWGTDANDIPVREAFEWTRKGTSSGMAAWYQGRGTDEWWTDRYAKDSDGISVEEEELDSTSLLSFYRRLLKLRRERSELVSGEQRFLETDRGDVLAVLRSSAGLASLLLVNLADSSTTVGISHCHPESFANDQDRPPEGAKAGLCLPRSLAPPQDEHFRDLLSGNPEGSTDSTLRVNLPPFGIKLLSIP